jgi:MFS family permease
MAFGILMFAVALAPNVLLACVALVPMGAASLAFVSTANATLQLNSREEMRGRIMSLYAMGFLGTTPIGALAVSAIAEATNPRVALGVGAAATIGASVFLAAVARVPRPVVVAVPAAASPTGAA